MDTILSIYKKSAGFVLVTHPTLRGLRIARFGRTSNAEAYADIIIPQYWKRLHNASNTEYITIPIGIYRCFILDQISESCEVSKSQDIA
jgi:hypothetical protein